MNYVPSLSADFKSLDQKQLVFQADWRGHPFCLVTNGKVFSNQVPALATTKNLPNLCSALSLFENPNAWNLLDQHFMVNRFIEVSHVSGVIS